MRKKYLSIACLALVPVSLIVTLAVWHASGGAGSALPWALGGMLMFGMQAAVSSFEDKAHPSVGDCFGAASLGAAVLLCAFAGLVSLPENIEILVLLSACGLGALSASIAAFFDKHWPRHDCAVCNTQEN